MRTVAEYLSKAVELDTLAVSAPDDALKKRYADLAECYRLLAKERERLGADGTISSDQPPM
jgi:hypothetical protein